MIFFALLLYFVSPCNVITCKQQVASAALCVSSVTHTGTLASLTVYCLRWRNHKIAHLEPGHFTAEQSYRFIADNSAHSLFVLVGVLLRTKTVE